MKSKAVQFLEANQSGERSTFVDDAQWRQENASWLRRSRKVAYAIMDYMQDCHLSRNDVAEKLDVSPQHVSKILSGKVNFSFKTISEIEERLGMDDASIEKSNTHPTATPVVKDVLSVWGECWTFSRKYPLG